MASYPQFEPGQRVRTVYGQLRTEECRGWYHPTKVWPLSVAMTSARERNASPVE
jgi:hypothetical protein